MPHPSCSWNRLETYRKYCVKKFVKAFLFSHFSICNDLHLCIHRTISVLITATAWFFLPENFWKGNTKCKYTIHLPLNHIPSAFSHCEAYHLMWIWAILCILVFTHLEHWLLRISRKNIFLIKYGKYLKNWMYKVVEVKVLTANKIVFLSIATEKKEEEENWGGR